MTLQQIADLLSARVLTCEELLDTPVDNVFCTDLMADVLAFASSHTVLITRLVNLAVVRSSLLTEIHCVVFSDGVCAEPALRTLAETHDLVLMETPMTMLDAT